MQSVDLGQKKGERERERTRRGENFKFIHIRYRSMRSTMVQCFSNRVAQNTFRNSTTSHGISK
jgi:hypothetical protein